MATSYTIGSLLIVSLVALAGLVIFVLGLRGRRIGADPLCRRCGYNLTGLTSNVCPECGVVADGANVVYGRRRRMRLVLVAGILVFVVGVSLVGIGISRRSAVFNALQFYPLNWVLDDAESGDRPALDELLRRSGLGQMTVTQGERIAAAALKKQAATPADGNTQAWIDLLEDLLQLGVLTAEQEQTYYAQMIRLRLEVRPRVRAGSRLPYRLHRQGVGPSTSSRTYRMNRRVLAIDGEPVEPDSGDWHSGEVGTLGSKGWNGLSERLPDLAPGRHTLTLTVECLIYESSNWDAQGKWREVPPLWSGLFELSQDFEVLPADAPDPVDLIDDPPLADEIRKAITIKHVRLRPGLQEGEYSASVSVDFAHQSQGGSPLPAAVAFRVLLRTTTGEHEIGQVSATAGTTNHSHSTGSDVPPFADETVDVILETEIEAARGTTDIFRIWNGTIVFEDVPVVREEK